MGNQCLNPFNEQYNTSKSVQLTTEAVKTVDKYITSQVSINKVKSIPTHKSRKMLEYKWPSSRHLLESEANTRSYERRASVNIDEKYDSMVSNLKSSRSYMKCPTNFKIEPRHFRTEKKKETLNDRYTIEEVIGKGKFGEVKRIRDKSTKLHRALKIINKANCQETDNLVDEIEIIKSLASLPHHP